jgi:hypothetical protein
MIIEYLSRLNEVSDERERVLKQTGLVAGFAHGIKSALSSPGSIRAKAGKAVGSVVKGSMFGHGAASIGGTIGAHKAIPKEVQKIKDIPSIVKPSPVKKKSN